MSFSSSSKCGVKIGPSAGSKKKKIGPSAGEDDNKKKIDNNVGAYDVG